MTKLYGKTCNKLSGTGRIVLHAVTVKSSLGREKGAREAPAYGIAATTCPPASKRRRSRDFVRGRCKNAPCGEIAKCVRDARSHAFDSVSCFLCRICCRAMGVRYSERICTRAKGTESRETAFWNCSRCIFCCSLRHLLLSTMWLDTLRASMPGWSCSPRAWPSTAWWAGGRRSPTCWPAPPSPGRRPSRSRAWTPAARRSARPRRTAPRGGP